MAYFTGTREPGLNGCRTSTEGGSLRLPARPEMDGMASRNWKEIAVLAAAEDLHADWSQRVVWNIAAMQAAISRFSSDFDASERIEAMLLSSGLDGLKRVVNGRNADPDLFRAKWNAIAAGHTGVPSCIGDLDQYLPLEAPVPSSDIQAFRDCLGKCMAVYKEIVSCNVPGLRRQGSPESLRREQLFSEAQSFDLRGTRPFIERLYRSFPQSAELEGRRRRTLAALDEAIDLMTAETPSTVLRLLESFQSCVESELKCLPREGLSSSSSRKAGGKVA